MLGNDVIDLADADTCHPRFDDRVFTASERALLAATPRRDRLRWLLWAAKESAYKAARKDDLRTLFSPARFVVALHDSAGNEPASHARVVHGARRFDIALTEGDGWVHAIARPVGVRAPRAHAAVAARNSRDDESNAVRRLAIEALAPALDVVPARLAIRRDGRVPTLWLDGSRTTADLSLSHHGRFTAFACDLP
jgi:4'-phosphopantetheinyl transferase EntD